MLKRKPFIVTLLVAMVVCSLALTCYASEITITSVTFEKYTDQYGNENDANLVMKIEFNAPSETTQISVCVLGEDIEDIVQAEANNKLIYMGQFDTPSSGILMIPLSKAAILTATGATNVDGATIYVKMGGKTVADMETKEVTVTLPQPAVIKGDVTGDGEVNGRDSTQILRYDVNLRTFSETELLAGDVTGDGAVDIFDAVWVLRFAAGLIE